MNNFSASKDNTMSTRMSGPGLSHIYLCNGLAGIRQHRAPMQAGSRKIRGLWVCAAYIKARDDARAAAKEAA
jgi:hypothetical protein